jgi:sulfite reductase alpha subunit-like flavoprotein
VRVFVQKTHGFTLPADPGAPVIMIGPGTGIPPFRAFLHDRMAVKAPRDATGCSSAINGTTTISSMRTSSPA